MAYLRYCKHCQDYIPKSGYAEHMKSHQQFENSDAREHKQYHGFVDAKTNDYMICVLHQKKAPCPVKDCKYLPFGLIRKSLLLSYAKTGIYLSSDQYGNRFETPIDLYTRIVVLMGVPIQLKV